MEDLSGEQKQQLGLTSGVAIASVEPGSAAALAGLQPGDVLLCIGNQNLTTSDEIPRVLFQHRVGEVVKFRVLRDGRERDLPVRIGARD
jgi:serine protease Do